MSMDKFSHRTPPAAESVKLVFASCCYENNIREHAHACSELILIKKGSCTVHAGPHTLQAGTGDMITMPAHQVHDQTAEEPIETVFCGFNAPASLTFSDPHVIPLPDSAFIEKCMMLLVSIRLNQLQAAEDAADTVFSAVLKQLRHQHSLHEEQKTIPPMLRVTLRYIDDNLDKPLLIKELADHMHMSVSHLQILFREHLDTSPLQYLNTQRMQAAKFALQTPYLSVKEVAAICGYPDVNYFIRTFRKIHGMPPGQWRKKQQNML